jgi:hypothetical protein
MARKLIQATPKEREVFIEEVHRYLDNQNIYNRLQALKTTETWTESEIADYNSCDEIIIHGMLIAEKRARKIKTTAWSPIFGTAVQKKSFWKIALSLKRNRKRPNDKILHWAESLGIDEFTTLDMAAIQTNLRKAQKELREIEKQADALREQHLRNLLTKSELEGDEPSIQRRLRIIIRAQKQKNYFQRLQTIFKPKNNGGLSYVLVPKDFRVDNYPYDPDKITEWEAIHDHGAVQELIQKRNIYHFGQAHGTPFTVPPLDRLKWQADTIEARDILTGSIPTDLMAENPHLEKVLKYMAERENLPDIDTYITPEQVSRGYKKWRETTSTSPSGCHLGLRRITSYAQEEKEIDSARLQILNAQTDIINLPLQHGFSPNRWRTVVNAMLEKIPGRPYLHKLRVIHILEADYNLALKEIFGRRLLWNCERYNKLGDIQDGFRKGRSTIRTLLHTELINDYNKRLRRDNFVGMTDISGCFDRIVAPVISILNKKNGCPQAAINMHATTLEKAKYHLKTKQGITETHYSHSTETPIYGNGQGAGDSPSQWCQQSTMLFDLFEQMNSGVTMTSPTDEDQIKTAMTAFADDANLLGNDDGQTQNIDDLVQKAQMAFTTWNGLLHATGHFMELAKCSCYLSVWSFQEDGYAFTEDPETHAKKIIVKDLAGNPLTIPQLHATTSQKLLGVMKNPIGNQQDEVARLQKKSDDLSRSINSNALHQGAILSPTVLFSTVATRF